MFKYSLLAVAIYATTLGGLFLLDSRSVPSAENLSGAGSQNVNQTMLDLLIRHDTGRLTDEEETGVAAAQEKFQQTMQEVATELEQAFEPQEDEMDLMVGRKAVNECLPHFEDDEAYMSCLNQFYQ
ncbi:hypothetical protein GOB57_22175 [Sinorhizobium meliloti]|nr:hypothetical protein [Sinorhizobium meliloti]